MFCGSARAFFTPSSALPGKTQQSKYRLEHAQTVPQAITATQVLKESQKKGRSCLPILTDKHGQTIGEAVAVYREHRDLLELFDPGTREGCSI